MHDLLNEGEKRLEEGLCRCWGCRSLSDRALNECFGTLDAEVLGPWTRMESMDKSRKLGWNGFVDTTEGIRATIEQLAELKMMPALK